MPAKALFMAIASCVLCLVASPAFCDVKIFENKDKTFETSLIGESLWRYEFWDWFSPSGPYDESYGYFFTRSRAGLKFETKKIDEVIQLQFNQFFNLPGVSSAAPAPQGPLGFGPTYFAQTGDRFVSRLFIKSLYTDVKNPFDIGLSARIGRFDYQDGLETLTGDPKIDWIKKNRLGERLIGPFGFSAFTRSFDGAWVWFDHKDFRADQLFCRPTQGGFEERAGNTIDKIALMSSSVTIKKSVLIKNAEERLFYVKYTDARNVTQRVDNTGIGSAPKVDIDINTFGMNLAGAWPIFSGEADGMVWTAIQQGDWYQLDHKAFAFAGEFGYQFQKIFAKPWIRCGYFYGSGDSNPSDGHHETFFQILPTTRLYALFPLYNLMNNEDAFVQMILKPAASLTVRSDFHFIGLAERNDRFYSGAGATQEKGTIFGYVGRPGYGEKDVGNLLDVSISYQVNKNLAVSAYYGHFFGGSVMKKLYPPGSNANLFFLEAGIKF